MKNDSLIILTAAGHQVVVPVERVQALDYRRSDFLGAAELHLVHEAAQNLLREVMVDGPEPLSGELLAMPTGELCIGYTDDDGNQQQRHFDVLSDHLLRDHVAPTIFYTLARPLMV